MTMDFDDFVASLPLFYIDPATIDFGEPPPETAATETITVRVFRGCAGDE
jgi:hypothetical protein